MANKKNKSGIAAHFRNINILFLVFIMVIVSVLSAFMIYSITDNVSENYARSYSVETVEILGLQLNRELSLIQHAAQSRIVADWFADENNPEKKAAAYQAMMEYAGLLQIQGVYFAIYDSLNEYSAAAGSPFEDFMPFNVISPLHYYDVWFFNCINSENEFVMNMDVDKITNTRRLWINHKVTDNGKILGVFCSALQFDEMFHELFNRYDSRNVIGYIIDEDGVIKIDSSVLQPDLHYDDISLYDTERQRYIQTVNSDPVFISEINGYLENYKGFFNWRVEPKVIKLSSGPFRYMSIAPIQNTNWVTVTLFNSKSLFSVTRLLPLFVILLSAFIIYVTASSALFRRLVFKPLNLLTASVSEEGSGMSEIYGVDRDDEIGELARTTRKTMNEIERRDRFLQKVNLAATVLLNTKFQEFERSLYDCMGMMANAVNADRVYIWKNHTHHGELYTTQIYEWSQGAEPQQGSEYTVNIPYRDTGWEEILLSGKCINSLVRDLSPAAQERLSPQGILSIFAAPVFLQEQFWGFVGFDDCHRERTFSDNEVSIVRSGCLLIVNAFLHNSDIVEIVRLKADLEEALERAQAASRAKSAFLANMSHEIRTPLNSIMGFSELALDGEVSVKTKNYLNRIFENAQGLLQIINDILDISKVESGRMELEKIPFDMHELLAGCRSLILPKAVEKGIILRFYVQPSIGKMLLGDPAKLRQIIINLLSNAVKFTNTGIVELFTEIKDQDDETVTIFFEIKDSGIGMTGEQISKIFDPFIQAESGTTRKYGGTGLGLAITKNFVELMGGTLSAESTPGVGSKFSFTLVFDTADISEDEKPESGTSFDGPEKPMFEGEVLLCEDNAMNQQVICEHLARVGLHTIVAENGKSGVEMVQHRMKEGKKQFDLIFMDMHMPVMDGLEASAKILELKTGIPIVAMTANIMPSDREIYRTSGMHDCVGKPFTSQELWRCLLKFLTPVSAESAKTFDDGQNETDIHKAGMKLQRELQIMFLKSNQNKFSEITKALDDGDIKLAHRLAHTLKGNAGHIGQAFLQQAAADVELQLKDGVNMTAPEQMDILEAELEAVLAELSPLNVKTPQPAETIPVEPLDAQSALELLEKLEPLLKMGNPDSLKLIDSLRRIPGSGEMILQIEDFDFEQAVVTLAELKGKIG
jgi:signal transduction histidine kinase/CheY-like chemotaxis protein